MNKYFKKDNYWQKKDKNTTGLPRPWALTAGAKSKLAKKVPMEAESYNSSGGTIILLALFGPNTYFG